MKNIRLIARMDIKGENLIKGIHLEGLRVLGPSYEFSKSYYHCGIDEILYIDCVASLYGRSQLAELVRLASREVFIPMTAGGGIRSVEDATELLRSGADKVLINTAATKNPGLLSQIAKRYGSQCLVLSIEAKRTKAGGWEVYTHNGRERTARSVVEWAVEGVERGAGEVLVTSIDQEGTRLGYDLELLEAVTNAIKVPVIASGGMGKLEDMVKAANRGGVDGLAIADALHYARFTVAEIRTYAQNAGLNVREYTE